MTRNTQRYIGKYRWKRRFKKCLNTRKGKTIICCLMLFFTFFILSSCNFNHLSENETNKQEFIEETLLSDSKEDNSNSEAVALARLADCTAVGCSDHVKEVVMWVAINRADGQNNGYSDDLITVINSPNQWQNYHEDARYSQASYELAEKVLNARNGDTEGIIPKEMLYMVMNDDCTVTVRNNFEIKGKMMMETHS